jgi:hypothetical protein
MVLLQLDLDVAVAAPATMVEMVEMVYMVAAAVAHRA